MGFVPASCSLHPTHKHRPITQNNWDLNIFLEVPMITWSLNRHRVITVTGLISRQLTFSIRRRCWTWCNTCQHSVNIAHCTGPKAKIILKHYQLYSGSDVYGTGAHPCYEVCLLLNDSIRTRPHKQHEDEDIIWLSVLAATIPCLDFSTQCQVHSGFCKHDVSAIRDLSRRSNAKWKGEATSQLKGRMLLC